jgi:TolB-like protein
VFIYISPIHFYGGNKMKMKHNAALNAAPALIAASALIVMLMAFAGCGGSPKPAAGADDLDAVIREAADYLNTRIPSGSKAAFINISGGYPDLSEYILSDLSKHAVNDGVFSVVDRAQLDAVRAELNFNLSGEVDDSSAQEIGKMLGAQTIVSGSVRKIGSLFRLDIKAIAVQTATVQGAWNKNIPNGATIAALTINTASGTAAATGQTAAGSRTSGGSTAAGGTAQAATPATPARPAAPKNGTYTFWPRPRATKAGMPAHWYLDKVIMGGNYMTVCVSSTARGVADYGGGESRFENAAYWFTNGTTRDCYLDSEDIPGRMWQPIKVGWQDSTYGGVYMIFENVVGKHFTMRGETHKPPVIMEIILDEPDE